ncbi:MAG: DUF6198 family protein [Eubacteriales bacterium]
MSQETFAKDTSTRTKKEWVQGLLVLYIGLVIAHLGVSLFLITDLGADTFTIFIQGISETIGLTIGTCHVIALILIMIIMLITTRGYIKPGTFVCAFLGGWIIDFFLWLFGDSISGDSPFFLRILITLLGCVILSFGMSIVIKSNSGTGPNDLIAIVLTDTLRKKHSISFRAVRIACDILFTIIGLLLGGIFGLGTIMAALIIGPLVQFFLPKSERMIRSIFPTL